MKRPRALPRALHGDAFDVRAAAALGVSVERLRRNDLKRPFHGVRVLDAGADNAQPRTEDEEWIRRREEARESAHHYAVRMPTDQFFSHVTAALLHGLWLPARLLEPVPVHVGTSQRGRRRKGSGVRGHFIPSRVRVVSIDGLPVASAVDSWCQLSTVLTLDELVMLGDSLVRRQAPAATMIELERAVIEHAGRPGARALREAFTLVRPRTDSPKETELRLLIVRGGLPEPEVNVRLLNRYGAFMALGDLVYRRYRILIEYDGGGHRGEKQYHRDIDRLDEPMEEQWRVIRVNKTHLGRPPALIARIRTALVDRGWTPA